MSKDRDIFARVNHGGGFQVRFTAEQWAAIERAAKRLGLTIARFIHDGAIEAADRANTGRVTMVG